MTDSTLAAEQGNVESVLETVRELFGEEHATYAAVLDTLTLRLRDAGDFAAAEDLCRESLGVWRRVHGEQHRNVAVALARLGTLLRLRGDEPGAEQALRESLALLEGGAEVDDLASYEARVELADLLSNRGEYTEADELLGESLALLRSSSSPSRLRILQTLEKRFLVQMNASSDEAADTLRAIYDETHEYYPDDSPLVAISAMSLGNYLAQRGEHAEAEPTCARPSSASERGTSRRRSTSWRPTTRCSRSCAAARIRPASPRRIRSCTTRSSWRAACGART